MDNTKQKTRDGKEINIGDLVFGAFHPDAEKVNPYQKIPHGWNVVADIVGDNIHIDGFSWTDDHDTTKPLPCSSSCFWSKEVDRNEIFANHPYKTEPDSKGNFVWVKK